MIPLPAAPTDNLYKFTFISGLLLVLAALILPPLIEQQRLEMSYQLRKESVERNRSIIIALATLATNDPELKDRNRRIEVLNDQSKIVEGIGNQEFERLNEEIKSRQAIVDKQLGYLNASMIIGTVLMLVGGMLWFTKAQKVQDKLLIAQLKEAEAKAASASSLAK